MPLTRSRNSLNAFQTLVVGDQAYTYFSLKVAEQTLGDLTHLPCCMRILLENLLRHEDEKQATPDDMRALTAYHALHKNIPTISFRPARFLIDDQAALSTLTDLAALHERMSATDLETSIVETSGPLDIVIGQSAETQDQKAERYSLIKWGQQNLSHVRVIPPGHGPCNHINLNALSPVVQVTTLQAGDSPLVVPDTVFGTDRYFSTINGLGVLGWSGDPLEIQSLILGHASRLSLPGVFGVKLTGKVHKGTTATDLALAIAANISKSKVAGKIVEFHGPGLDHLSIPDRAIIARMISETGALCSYFPIDVTTLAHLTMTGHAAQHIALVEAYAKNQGLWRDSMAHEAQREPTFTIATEIVLDAIRSGIAGPDTISTPITFTETASAFEKAFPLTAPILDPLAAIKHGDIALAVISSHEATSHPTELVMAGLFARKAANLGLKAKPWVRSLFSDMSPVSNALLEKSGLRRDLEEIGFDFTRKENLATAPAPLIQESIENTILKNKLTVCSIASVPQPEESRLSNVPSACFVTSPALVVAYAIAGTILADMNTKPLGSGRDGKSVMLKDLWPTAAEINAVLEATPLAPLYADFKETLFTNPSLWGQTPTPPVSTFVWNDKSCLVKRPPFLNDFDAKSPRLLNIKEARVLALLGDNIAASSIAPTGPILPDSPAGHYLTSHNVPVETFLTYRSKTGNHEIMARGAFTHPSLKNDLLPAGSACAGLTIHGPSKANLTIFDAAERYKREGISPIIVAAKNFGHGVGQEWAAKVIRLLDIRAVIAETFDPTFRVDLIRLGVLPLQLKSGIGASDLKLTGEESISFAGISDMDRLPSEVMMTIEHTDWVERYMVHCDIKTPEELDMLRNGSLWAFTLRSMPLPAQA